MLKVADTLALFCPHCGKTVFYERVKDQEGFKAVYQGSCKCGIIGVLAIRPMPLEPTFTLSFNKYLIPNLPTVR